VKKIIFFFCCLFFSTCFADDSWINLWHQGVDHLYQDDYQKAALKLDQAVNLMSEEDLTTYPYVLVARIGSSCALGDYEKILTDSALALKSKNITNEERLFCGTQRMTVFMKLGNEEAAAQEYQKYIIECPLLPKWEYSNEKIIIRNVLDCECYQADLRERLKTKYCESDKDICEYGNMWVINITKKKPSIIETQEGILLDSELEDSVLRAAHPIKRTPQEIQACCDTCNRLARAAKAICDCLPTTFAYKAPWTAMACSIACSDYVEEMRKDCVVNCQVTERAWKDFETWKAQYEKRYSQCPRPPMRCQG
jgi:hypothetical protein